jgi:very-short-patch-repair endonuclease
MIEPRLDETRRRLLDLSRRNRLLNHKPAVATNLRVVDEVAEEVYRTLVVEGQRMQFLSKEEAPEPAAIEEEFRAETQRGGDAEGMALAPLERHADRKLQTAVEGEKLQTKLLQIAREAASALEEQGANVLYLALGVVEWRETADGVASRAPLVFVPAELARKSVNSRFSLARFDDDVVTNPCLVELCARQFRLPFPELDPEGDLADYFARVEDVLQALPNWSLRREVHLGLFSFAKYLMYRDLDPATWPEARPLVAHPLVRALSGVEPGEDLAGDGIPDPATLDDTIAPDECYQVLDADSSQQAVILAAKQGASAVVEGPPGTGKSQTIANVVAECMSEGKTVLFVAEKSAALEVVKRRLEAVGLGAFVLELHSRKASKRAVLEEINRSLVADSDARRAAAVDARELAATRERLNAYVRALHAPVAPLGLSPFEAISRAVALSSEPEASCALPAVEQWSADQLAHARHLVETLDRRLERAGERETHPWRGAGLVAAGLQVQQRIKERGGGLVAAIREARDAARELAGLVGAVEPHTPVTIAELHEHARAVLAAPTVPAAVLGDARWEAEWPALRSWIERGEARARLKAAWSPVFAPEAETRDWRETLERRRRQKGSLLRFLTPSWYRDGRELRAHQTAEVSSDEQVAALSALVDSAAVRAAIETEAVGYGGLLGALWKGVDGDWSALRRAAEAVVMIRGLAASRDVSLDAACEIVSRPDRTALSASADRTRAALGALDRASAEWLEAVASADVTWYGRAPGLTTLDEAESRVLRALEAFEGLQDWADLNAAIAATRSAPVEPFVSWALSPGGRDARGRLASAFLRHFYRLWTDAAIERSEPLSAFRGEDHEALVERFRALDREWLEASKRRLADLVRASRPDMTRASSRESKLGVVQAEIRKQRNIMPLRRLLSVAGEVVQAIKPCFMMSPISVAQYLAPGAIDFDLVIFDEASQVEPADAYGAIARGRQLLLVGDERQLPPTSFFAKIESDEPSYDEEGDFSIADLESILAVGAVRLPNRSRLRWHYRSRHASLIQFSNERFYDDAPMRVFPSPHTGREELGLAFRYVEGGVYMRSAGQHNPVEAAAVAAEVMRHAIESPELSLGVGAFSISQQRAIQDEVERLRREATDPRVEAFFGSHPEEPFFVKNLETIQGDERDVVFLSVGYGPDAAGRITMNFGPLNREGGWRRLNVLVTRARRRCVLFSSFRADQMNLGGTTARGVVALKDYLYFAEHGRMPTTGAPTGEHDSPFEAEVCRALRARGWEVHAQVGAAGFSIDLAVVDPERPGRYLLGVECDGATYHASATARDRDRLRQAVLEGLGWTIHRVWSTDWFHRPEQVLAKLVARLEALRAGHEPARAVEQPKLPIFAAEPAVAVAAPALPPGVVAYRREQKLLGTADELARASVREIVAAIVAEESPIHVEEAARALAARFGTRASKRVQEAFDRGLASSGVTRRGDFLWSEEPVRVRYRGDGCPVVRPELIAPEEFEEAVRLALAREFGATREALAASTARLLGYSRRGPSLSAAIDSAIDALLATGAVRRDSHGFLVLES